MVPQSNEVPRVRAIYLCDRASRTLRGASAIIWFGAILLMITSAPSSADLRAGTERELEFASGLVRIGFADFAERIVRQLLDRSPDAAAAAAPVRIEILAAYGRFDEARQIIDAMPSHSPETMGMQLALADAYYARNRIREARDIYEAFFARYSDGPPDALRLFYRESAYRYAQMLLNSGHDEDALKAFGLILLTEPERGIKRRIQSEMAELAVRIGENAGGDKRERYFKQARDLCQALQWGGLDLWFGKSVVLLSHIAVIEGNTERARSIIREYLPMLQRIDEALREEGAPMRFSPMAECRYLLGKLHLRDAEEFMRNDEAGSATEQYVAALRHFHNVFVQYPGSAWAMQSGNSARMIVGILEGMGRTVRIPPYDMGPVVQAQLREARAMLDMNDFEQAESALRSVINIFPEEQSTIPVLADLIRCYIELDNPVYADAVTGYLAERFPRQRALSETAGATLLRVAGFYETAGRGDKQHEIYDLFLRHYPDHSRVAGLIMRLGEAALRAENYEQALDHFASVQKRFPDTREALDAMSRTAHCQGALGNYTNAIPALLEYLDALTAGPDMISARRRLADTYRANGQYADAAREYTRVSRMLRDEGNASLYAHSPEDILRNRLIYQQSLFWRAYSLSRLREPEDQVPRYQQEAIDSFRRFVDEFPEAELAPVALSMKGALHLLSESSEDAARIYDRLSNDYPESEQARNAVFAQGTSLIEMGRMEQALEVFQQMFENTGAFTPAQFLRVGHVMLEEKQFGPALKALRIAITATERAVWENASVHKSRALVNLGQHAEAVAVLEKLFERYPRTAYSMDAGFMLSGAYAHVAAEMSGAQARADTFQRSISTLRMVRRLANKPVDRARADLELASIQRLMGAVNDALASYLRLFLLGDLTDPDTRPLLERAYEEAMPLLFETGQYDEVVDNSRIYMELFPNGRLTNQARRWRNEAMAQISRAGGRIPEEEEEDEEAEIPDFQPRRTDNGQPPEGGGGHSLRD